MYFPKFIKIGSTFINLNNISSLYISGGRVLGFRICTNIHGCCGVHYKTRQEAIDDLEYILKKANVNV